MLLIPDQLPIRGYTPPNPNSILDWRNNRGQMISAVAEEDWHMPIESIHYLIILLFRVNSVFIFHTLLAGDSKDKLRLRGLGLEFWLS